MRRHDPGMGNPVQKLIQATLFKSSFNSTSTLVLLLIFG